MIDSKCKECKAYLPVDSADAMVLHAVTQKYKQRCKPGYEHQRCHDGQDLTHSQQAWQIWESIRICSVWCLDGRLDGSRFMNAKVQNALASKR